mgnify:CR=1 FL=1
MSGSINWRFPPNNGGTIQGFNDSGIATFAGAELYNNLAREICLMKIWLIQWMRLKTLK